MMRKRAIVGALCAFLAVSAETGMAGAETVEGEAVGIVRKAADYLADRASFSFEVDLEYELTFGTQTERDSEHFSLAFKRPQQLSLHRSADDAEIRFVADSRELVVYMPEFRQYIVEEAPNSVSEIVETSSYGPFTLVMALVAEFLKEGPFNQVLEGLTSATYLGLEEVDGTECDHVQIAGPEGSWDLWVETGTRPVIRRIVPDASLLEAELKTGGIDDADLIVDARLGSWSVDNVADNAIAFEVAEGLLKVTQFQPPSPPMRLLGKPAPSFSLEFLDGGTFDLAETKGTEIVIIDFWATWCGPCRQVMPVIERVAEEFREDGVRLYAVNLMEDPKNVRRFLESQELDLTVLLDTRGSVATQYRADAIPQTVIIGRDGTVQVVHVGSYLDLEAELTNELTALVKGEKLVE